MSFDELVGSNVAKKTKKVTLSVFDEKTKKDKKLVFTAHELNYPERLQLAGTTTEGAEQYCMLLVLSIRDQNGNPMTMDQARALPDKYFQPLFVAATEVNNVDAEKN